MAVSLTFSRKFGRVFTRFCPSVLLPLLFCSIGISYGAQGAVVFHHEWVDDETVDIWVWMPNEPYMETFPLQGRFRGDWQIKTGIELGEAPTLPQRPLPVVPPQPPPPQDGKEWNASKDSPGASFIQKIISNRPGNIAAATVPGLDDTAPHLVIDATSVGIRLSWATQLRPEFWQLQFLDLEENPDSTDWSSWKPYPGVIGNASGLYFVTLPPDTTSALFRMVLLPRGL